MISYILYIDYNFSLPFSLLDGLKSFSFFLCRILFLESNELANIRLKKERGKVLLLIKNIKYMIKRKMKEVKFQ